MRLAFLMCHRDRYCILTTPWGMGLFKFCAKSILPWLARKQIFLLACHVLVEIQHLFTTYLYTFGQLSCLSNHCFWRFYLLLLFIQRFAELFIWPFRKLKKNFFFSSDSHNKKLAILKYTIQEHNLSHCCATTTSI